MKITRRQLRKIIAEAIKTSVLKEEITTLAGLVSAGIIDQSLLAVFQECIAAGLVTEAEIIAAAPAVAADIGTAGGGGSVLAGLTAAEIVLIIAGIAGIAGMAITGSMAALETLGAKKRSTAEFIFNVIKRAMSEKLKSDKANMDETTIKMAHRALKSRNMEALKVALETGLLKLDVNELYGQYDDMRSSASAEYVDFNAVDAALKEIRKSLKS